MFLVVLTQLNSTAYFVVAVVVVVVVVSLSLFFPYLTYAHQVLQLSCGDAQERRYLGHEGPLQRRTTGAGEDGFVLPTRTTYTL